MAGVVWLAYKITRHGKTVEEHNTLREATRAFWILSAHELKHGRVADYNLDTGTCDSVANFEHCRPSIPGWALEVLREHCK